MASLFRLSTLRRTKATHLCLPPSLCPRPCPPPCWRRGCSALYPPSVPPAKRRHPCRQHPHTAQRLSLPPMRRVCCLEGLSVGHSVCPSGGLFGFPPCADCTTSRFCRLLQEAACFPALLGGCQLTARRPFPRSVGRQPLFALRPDLLRGAPAPPPCFPPVPPCASLLRSRRALPLRSQKVGQRRPPSAPFGRCPWGIPHGFLKIHEHRFACFVNVDDSGCFVISTSQNAQIDICAFLLTFFNKTNILNNSGTKKIQRGQHPDLGST